MIYFNSQTETEPPARLRLTQRNLALALDENNRLRAENEELQQAIDSRGAGMWALVESNNRAIDAQYRRIQELCAELEDARAENVRLTGQIHTLLATIEQAVKW